MTKTGGGNFIPQLKAADELLLGLMDEQVQPLENVFDDAALYFGKAKVTQVFYIVKILLHKLIVKQLIYFDATKLFVFF